MIEDIQIASAADIAASGRLDPNGVEVFENPNGMGKSVRTTRVFEKDEIVCSYGGRKLQLGDETDYGFQMSTAIIVDGNPAFPESRGHVGIYINDATGPIKQPGAVNNVYFSVGNVRTPDRGTIPAIWLRAKKRLSANTELFVYYGKGYWRKKGFKSPTE